MIILEKKNLCGVVLEIEQLYFLFMEKVMRKKPKEKQLQNNVLHEMIRIKRQYCKDCEYFVQDGCTKSKVYRECLRKNGRLKRSEVNG